MNKNITDDRDSEDSVMGHSSLDSILGSKDITTLKTKYEAQQNNFTGLFKSYQDFSPIKLYQTNTSLFKKKKTIDFPIYQKLQRALHEKKHLSDLQIGLRELLKELKKISRIYSLSVSKIDIDSLQTKYECISYEHAYKMDEYEREINELQCKYEEEQQESMKQFKKIDDETLEGIKESVKMEPRSIQEFYNLKSS
jgi:hypothetical protein